MSLDLKTNLTPEQVEESKALAETKVQEELAKQPDAIEVGTMMYGHYSPIFAKNVKELSTGQLRRLCQALVMHGMNDIQYADPTDNKLKETIAMGLNLVESKFIMQLTMAQEQLSKEEGSTENEPISK